VKGKDHFEDIGVDGRIILKWKERGCGLVSCGSG